MGCAARIDHARPKRPTTPAPRHRPHPTPDRPVRRRRLPKSLTDATVGALTASHPPTSRDRSARLVALPASPSSRRQSRRSQPRHVTRQLRVASRPTSGAAETGRHDTSENPFRPCSRAARPAAVLRISGSSAIWNHRPPRIPAPHNVRAHSVWTVRRRSRAG